MSGSSENFLDRTAARTVLRGTTASVCGMIGSFIVIAMMLWIHIPGIKHHFEGKYYQSTFQLQQPSYTRLVIPRDFKTALVFYNKTSNQVANHTRLKEIATFNAYLTQKNSRVNL